MARSARLANKKNQNQRQSASYRATGPMAPKLGACLSCLGERGDRSRGRVPGDVLGRALERHRACPQISHPLVVHAGSAGLGQHRGKSFLIFIHDTNGREGDMYLFFEPIWEG